MKAVLRSTKVLVKSRDAIVDSFVVFPVGFCGNDWRINISLAVCVEV